MSELIYDQISKLSVLDTSASKIVANKTISFVESCDRIRLHNHEALSWAALLEDFTAFSTSLGLLKEACPISFNALAVVPTKVPADLEIATSIPDILSVYPGDEAYEEIQRIQSNLKEIPSMKDKLNSIGADIQNFNRVIDEAQQAFQKKAGEAINQLDSFSESC